MKKQSETPGLTEEDPNPAKQTEETGHAEPQADEADSLRSELEALKTQAKKREAEDLVALSIKEGKVTPAQREWAASYAGTDPEGFKSFVSKAPTVVPTGESGANSVLAGGRGPLDAVQRQVNTALAIGEETYRKYGR